MKKSIIYTVILFLVPVCLSVAPVQAQEKTQEQKEKEAQLQQVIEEQKKALKDQQQKAEELQQMFEEQQKDASRYRDAAFDEYIRRPSSGMSGRGGSDQRLIVSPNVDFPSIGFFGRGIGDSERTTWDFSKSVKESSFSRQYSFDVEKTAHNVVMSVTGDCKEGEIRVKIIMPGGKTYSDILIDQYGNLNWRKSFTIAEEENKDKTGEWIFKIAATKATGYFKISLQTY
jgi:hypothetical protein